MSQSGQAPERARDGSTIPQATIPGRNVDFVQPSDISSGTLSLAAAGSASDIGTFSVYLTITRNGKVVQWDHCIAWNYPEFYIDVETVGNTYRDGGSLTAAQKRIDMAYKPLIFVAGPTPSVYSHITQWSFRNADGSAHSIIGYFTWKYIETV